MTVERALIWARELRISQWTKNGIVFLAWFFAYADKSQAAMARGWRPFALTALTAASFCLMSSAFYLLNDVADCEADKLHPVKKLRPVASGAITQIAAVRAALALFSCALAFPAYLVLRHPDRTFGFTVILAYALLQSLYSGVLKRIPYIDVGVIATGFVLRAVAGAAAMDVRISPWLLCCAFVLSLFLALCKRRHEMFVALASREALAGYHPVALDSLIFVSAACTVAVYAAYTLAGDTVARFGTRALVSTAAFVAAGVARYLLLLYSRRDVGRPEAVLLTDRYIWLALAGYGASAIVSVCLGR